MGKKNPIPEEKRFYRLMEFPIQMNDYQRNLIDGAIEFQHRAWNWLVKTYNPEVKDKLANQKGKSAVPYSNRLEREIKAHFISEKDQIYYASRIIRGVAEKYITAWDRTFLVAKCKQPTTHDESFTKSVVVVDTTAQISEKNTFAITSNDSVSHFSKCRVKLKNPKRVKQIKDKGGWVVGYTVKRTFSHYTLFLKVCFDVDTLQPIETQQQGQIGLDWGISNYLTDNLGRTFNPPRSFVKQQKRIKCLYKVLSRKSNGSKNFLKVCEKLQNAYRKLYRIRRDWLYKFTLYLVKNYSEICLEDFDVEQLYKASTHGLQFKIGCYSCSEFRTILRQRVEQAPGCKLIMIDQKTFPSTKTCCVCGHREHKPLKQRTVNCKKCGNNIDRDQNAAINLIQFYNNIKCEGN